MANAQCWDERDLELGLRDQMAKLIATKVSGIKNPEPLPGDYDLADTLGRMIEDWVGGNYEHRKSSL